MSKLIDYTGCTINGYKCIGPGSDPKHPSIFVWKSLIECFFCNGIIETTGENIKKKKSVCACNSRHFISAKGVKRIIELYEKGVSTNKIARIFKVNYQLIRAILVKAKIKLRTSAEQEILSKNRKQLIVKDYLQTALTINQIAKKHNINKTTVYRILVKFDLKPSRNGHPAFSLSQQQQQQLCDDYIKLELSSNDLAKKFKISGRTALRILKTNNVPRRKGKAMFMAAIHNGKHITAHEDGTFSSDLEVRVLREIERFYHKKFNRNKKKQENCSH